MTNESVKLVYCNLLVMKVPELRWKGCVRQTNEHLFHATGAMYVQRFVNPSVKQRVGRTGGLTVVAATAVNFRHSK